MLGLTLNSMAQQKLEKISQSINVDDDVSIELNTSYTDIEIDTWNKDIIEVEAYMESNQLSNEELQKVFDSWNVNVDGSKSSVVINSGGSLNTWSNGITLFEDGSLDALKELEIRLADIPNMPVIENLVEMEWNFEDMPQIPNLPDLPDGMNEFHFDTDQYEKEGEAYLERWSKEYEEKYGKEYSKKMKKWAENFDAEAWTEYEKKMEEWGEKFGEEFGKKFGEKFELDMEDWSEKFEEDMEEWSEKFELKLKESGFEERMEAYGEELAKRIEDQLQRHQDKEDEYEGLFEYSGKANGKVKKTIKIKIPKKAKIKMNVRHGELKVASVLNNIKADVSHGSLILNSIDGGDTSINASYSSVFVKNWNKGSLNLNFVEDALLQHVDQLILNSNSSDIGIDYVKGNAVIDGSFGELTIHNLIDTFSNLNVIIENSDAYIRLPEFDYNLFYNGTRSRYNNELTNTKTINNGNNDNKTIVINAKYSNVVTQ